MIRTCDTCAREYDAKTVRSRYCSTPCRRRANYTGAAKRRGQVVEARPQDATVVHAVRQALGGLGVLDTPRGRAALVLAGRLDAADQESGAGLASLARQLDALVASALAESPGSEPDPLDVLRARRRARVWEAMREQAVERKAERTGDTP